MRWVIKRSFIGSRIIKSCLAAFVTAFICEALNWPPLFAVMTAIVSIENTSVDSFKKGLVRFPASAIGAAFAMLAEDILGRGAITYGLAASLTLIACFKLKLYDGMVVAVLTAVAMIPETYGHYFDSFIIRLGTTLTGIAVATLINYFIMPPNYKKVIDKKVRDLVDQTAQMIETVLDPQKKSKSRLRMMYQESIKSMETGFKLIRFQRSEWRFHLHHTHEIKEITSYQRRLEQIQKIMYHLGNLIYAPVNLSVYEDKEERRLVERFIQLLTQILRKTAVRDQSAHDVKELILTIDHLFERLKNEQDKPVDGYHHLTPQLMILYELLAIHEIITLNDVCSPFKKAIKPVKLHSNPRKSV